MTILFLTGGLEPGKDGVGDYTRRLAFECARNRHDCLLIALNDGNIEIPTETTEVEDHIQLRTLRLPQKLSWPARIKLASVFRAPYSIDWISLQFVCYSFHPKGFGFNLGKLLQPVVNGCPVHLMFHELWVGVGDERLSLKQRLVAGIQRQGIRKLIREIQPRCVTTSNSFYGTLLKNINVTAMILPLFGNIPFKNIPSENTTNPKDFLSPETASQLDASAGHFWVLFFGTLHPEWKPEPLFSHLISYSEKSGRRLSLLGAGRLGKTGELLWNDLQRTYAKGIDFFRLDERSAEDISALMQMSDLGIATSPWHLIGKSGSAVAMLEHGLPVVVTRISIRPKKEELGDELLIPCDSNFESRLLSGLVRRPFHSRLPSIAQDFIHYLALSNKE